MDLTPLTAFNVATRNHGVLSAIVAWAAQKNKLMNKNDQKHYY